MTKTTKAMEFEVEIISVIQAKFKLVDLIKVNNWILNLLGA